MYQLGAGYSTDLNSLLRMRRIVGPEHTFKVENKDFRVGEVRDTTCLIDLVPSRLGYEPEADLEEGLRRTWAWFQEHYGVGQAGCRVGTQHGQLSHPDTRGAASARGRCAVHGPGSRGPW